MASKKILTAALLREHLRYDPETGDFAWLIIIPGRTPIPGSRHTKGYMRISVFGKRYQSHRLAWLWMTGEWPRKIDHIDRNKANNKWSNLRVATNQQNGWNRDLGPLPRSGFRGVRQLKHGRWHARVGQHHVGVFDTAEEAYEAYERASSEIKGEFKQIERPRRTD